VVLGTLQGVTVRHHGRVQTIVTGPRPLGELSYSLMPAAVPVSTQDKRRFPRRLASYEEYRRLSAWSPDLYSTTIHAARSSPS
jgi:hypothetical protein